MSGNNDGVVMKTAMFVGLVVIAVAVILAVL